MKHSNNSHLTLAGFIGLSVCLHGVLLLQIDPPHPLSIENNRATLSIAREEKREEKPEEKQQEPADSAPKTQTQPARLMPDGQTTPKQTTTTPVQKKTTTEVVQTNQQKTTASSLQVSNEIKRELQARLKTRFQYPLLAIRHGWQGDVQLAFRIHANGQLSDIRIARSSGYAILDRSAIEALRKVRRAPEALRRLEQEYLDLTLPIRYQLKEG